MKIFTLNKVEHHQMMRYYNVTMTEDEVKQILDDEPPNRVDELLKALSDTNDPLHQEAVDILSGSDFAFERWEWSDCDDIWTDRKGGYEVSYELADVSSDESGSSPDWPFPHTAPITETAATAWPFDSKESPESESEVKESIIHNCIEKGSYTIKIYSRGYEAGIGEITKAHYDFWSEQDEDVLAEALNQNIDYDDIECPPEAQFEYYYNEYSDAGFVYGPDSEYSAVEIISPNGTILYDGELSVLLETINDKLEDDITAQEYVAEYLVDDQEPGYYLLWEMNGKGLYYEGSIELDGFDYTKLRFTIAELESISVIDKVLYDDQEIENDGGNWDGKYSSYSVHHVE